MHGGGHDDRDASTGLAGTGRMLCGRTSGQGHRQCDDACHGGEAKGCGCGVHASTLRREVCIRPRSVCSRYARYARVVDGGRGTANNAEHERGGVRPARPRGGVAQPEGARGALGAGAPRGPTGHDRRARRCPLGRRAPETWPKQLQASIGRVRTAIGRNAIETSPGAYTLHIDPETVDAERFERLAASARRHLDDDPARAADAAERALALWRGIPYADLAAWPPRSWSRSGSTRCGWSSRRCGSKHACTSASTRHPSPTPSGWCARRRCGSGAGCCSPPRSTGAAGRPTRSRRSAQARERLADELGAEPGAELIRARARHPAPRRRTRPRRGAG